MTIAGKISAAAAVALAMTGVLVAAQDLPQLFHINPARSSATFAIPAHGEQANGQPNNTTHGSLRIQRTTLRFVEDSHTMTGQVVLSAATENTGSHKRDVAIRSQVLDAPQYGTITFAPMKYEGTIARTGDSEIQVMGVLTLVGQQHPITVPVTVHSNGYECSASGTLVVPYLSWGVHDLGAAGLSGAKEVDVTLKLVGYLGPRN